jgi:transcriptional regulator with XRE-family HTH domain
MPSPFSSAQAARERVAARLKELRLDAELNGRTLADLCGWNPAKSSRIENAKTPPSDADIRAWCRACGADDQAPDIIAASRSAEQMYVQFRRMHRRGMRAAQEEIVPLFEQTRTFRAYCSNVMPGFFQTREYATAILRMFAGFQGTPDDSEAAADARVTRNLVVHRGGHRFAVLVEEHVLRHRFADDAVMIEQLAYLLAVMSLPNVSLGVVPLGARRSIWGLEAFYLFDDKRVNVETLTAAVNVVAVGEIADYARAFEELSKAAVYGDKARALISAAIAAIE